MAGSRGQIGLPGLQGLKGMAGDIGMQGLSGLPGLRGPLGFRGEDGSEGLIGLPGQKGFFSPFFLISTNYSFQLKIPYLFLVSIRTEGFGWRTCSSTTTSEIARLFLHPPFAKHSSARLSDRITRNVERLFFVAFDGRFQGSRPRFG